MVVGGGRRQLQTGDEILFVADGAHEYWNEGDGPLPMYLVMTHASREPAAPGPEQLVVARPGQRRRPGPSAMLSAQ
jgi:quercetin dioxygenase-like cupin family protein